MYRVWNSVYKANGKLLSDCVTGFYVYSVFWKNKKRNIDVSDVPFFVSIIKICSSKELLHELALAINTVDGYDHKTGFESSFFQLINCHISPDTC